MKKETKKEIVKEDVKKTIINKCNRCGFVLQQDDTLCPKCLAPIDWKN